MRKSLIAALFAASIAAGTCTAANAAPAGASLITAKVTETNVTQVFWRGRSRAFGYRRVYWRGWHRPRVYGFYRRRVLGFRTFRYGYRPRFYAYSYAPRSYGWSGYRRCW
jgi:hypothetical protein